MDFKELLKPYSENGRTIGGQINWLAKEFGLPQNSIDYAISNVYGRIKGGAIFENGKALDMEILRVAREHYNSDLESQFLKRIEEVKTNINIEESEWKKLSFFQKIKLIWKGLD